MKYAASWVSSYSDSLCKLLTDACPRVTFLFFRLRTSLTCLLLYAHFLRMRYFMSTYTRNYIDGIFSHVDRLLTTHPKVPPTVAKTYAKVKEAWMSDPIEKKKL